MLMAKISCYFQFMSFYNLWVFSNVLFSVVEMTIS